MDKHFVKIYIAGALNADAPGYIQNVHRMVKYAEDVRKLGVAVHVPANDFIHGVICGDHCYADYFDNNLPWLLVSDAVALVPGWENSKGVNEEIEMARLAGIPVLKTFEDVVQFLYYEI